MDPTAARRERERRALLTPEELAAEDAELFGEEPNATALAAVREREEAARTALTTRRQQLEQRETNRRAALTQAERNTENAAMRHYENNIANRHRRRQAEFNAETARIAALPAEQRAIAEQQRIAMPMPRARAEEIRVNRMHVHREASKYREKLPLILELLREDLGEKKEYPDIIAHVEDTIGKFLRESPIFETKAEPNSKLVESNNNSKPSVVVPSKIKSRAEWLSDYDRVIKQLETGLQYIPADTVQLLGTVIDFVFKHNLQDCYISNFIFDTAYAYEGETSGPHSINPISCFGGVIERSYITLFNCIKGLEGDIFSKIDSVLRKDKVTRWANLDKSLQTLYIQEWNRFILDWAQQHQGDEELQKMRPEVRNERVLSAFKERPGEDRLPKYVEDYIRSELFPGLITLWPDIGFNVNAAAQGGRRTRKQKRRSRKTHRKNKKYSRRRAV